MKIIVLDAGHGQSNRKKGVWDPGAVAGGIEEALVAWKWVMSLKHYLGKLGVPVRMTRQGYEDDCPLNSRRAGHGALLVSVHCNAAANPKAHGAEVLMASVQLGHLLCVADRLVATLASCPVSNRGVKERSGLAVLNNSKSAVLLEVGFLSNLVDRTAIISDAHRKNVCQRLADALAGCGLVM